MTQVQIGISTFFLTMLLFGIIAIALVIYRAKNNKREIAENFKEKLARNKKNLLI